MKKWVGIMMVGTWLVVLAPACLAAVPQDPVNVIGGLIKTNQYALAQQRITEYLESNPNDVNVLMMQGNLVLNEKMAQNAADYTVLNESIYQKTNGYKQTAPLLIPQTVAIAVAQPWQKCLELDPGRSDIREGLAYLYAQAGMKTELIALLPTMQNHTAKPSEVKYLMCNLAALLAERIALPEAIEVYQAIKALYPQEPVVYADLAETLLQHGRLTEAKQYLAAGVALPGSDKKQFYWTTFKLEATLGNYSQALAALQALAKLTRKQDWQLYQSLLSYYNNKPQWSREMRSFLAAPSDATDSNNRDLAKFLLSTANRHDYASYQKSLTYKVDAAFMLLLHQRAMRLFPNQAAPVVNYAEFHNIHHHYTEALRVLAPWETRPLINPGLLEEFQLQYAWALQNADQPEKANRHWMKLFNAKDFFIKSAAVYFYGKNFYLSGKPEEAAKFFKMVAPEASRSKFAFYSWRMLTQLEPQTTTAPLLPMPLETPSLTPLTTPTSTPEPVPSGTVAPKVQQ